MKKSNVRLTTAEFIARSMALHGDRYSYAKSIYVNAHTKIVIGCKIHGDFLQKATNHSTRGCGCWKCLKQNPPRARLDSQENFVEKAKKVHGNRYSYEKVVYTTSKKAVIFVCRVHGDFSQKPNAHVQGKGCRECAKIAVADACRSTLEKFIEKARKIHGELYSYENIQEYTNSSTKVPIVCSKHGVFWQRPSEHLVGYGCLKCSYTTISKALLDTQESFIEKAIALHGDKYDYSEVAYVDSVTKVKIKCPLHGPWLTKPNSHLNERGCSTCGNIGPSKGENELADFLRTLVGVDTSNRAIIAPYEIDCVIPSANLGIEYCGVYFHSDKFKTKDYHLDKLQRANSAGFDLLQIFDTEWKAKSAIVKSILRNRLGFTERKEYARTTEIKNVSVKDSKAFLLENHLQGYANAELRFGLYQGDELLLLATFSDRRRVLGGLEVGWFELVRLCTLADTSVIGGFSKILKHFIKTTNALGIKTYCDRRFFNGAGYEAVGFTKVRDSVPGYTYIKQGQQFSRYSFQKHKLRDKLEFFDPLLSENENMMVNGYSRLYDCGNAVFEMNLTSP